MNDNKIENLIKKVLRAEGERIIPPKELLTEIVSRAGVTEKAAGRYSVRSGNRGMSFFDPMVKFFSANGGKVLISAGVIMAVVFFSSPLFSKMKNNQLPQAEQKMYTAFLPKEAENKNSNQGKEVALAEENNYINESVDVILAGSFEDEELSAETASAEILDTSFADDENETINNFIKIYEAEQL